MTGLPSLLDMTDRDKDRVRFAVATLIALPVPPMKAASWDITLYCATTKEPLACDPFSFSGEFMDAGVRWLVVDLLGPAGFAYHSAWIPNFDKTKYQVQIARKGRYLQSAVI